jgi:hypothetical protein
MLKDEINKYNEYYAQLVSAFAELHNQNLIFVRTTGRTPGYLCRRELRNVEELATKLKKQSQLVCKEQLANIKLEIKLKKEEKRNAKYRRTTKRTL